MPKVKKGETRKAYASRCISQVMKEGGSHNTPRKAAGKCYGMYDSAKLRKRGKKK